MNYRFGCCLEELPFSMSAKRLSDEYAFCKLHLHIVSDYWFSPINPQAIATLLASEMVPGRCASKYSILVLCLLNPVSWIKLTTITVETRRTAWDNRQLTNMSRLWNLSEIKMAIQTDSTRKQGSCHPITLQGNTSGESIMFLEFVPKSNSLAASKRILGVALCLPRCRQIICQEVILKHTPENNRIMHPRLRKTSIATANFCDLSIGNFY